MVTETHFGTNVTADRKACFRPRNIKIAGTVGVANANIFHGLGFRRHDGVGCAGSGGRGKGGNGGKKDSSDIHFEWPLTGLECEAHFKGCPRVGSANTTATEAI